MSSDDDNIVLSRYISNMRFIIQFMSFDEISLGTYDYTMFDIVQDTLEGEFAKLRAQYKFST